MKKKEKSRVSVIVPVYNVEKYLGLCLDSLLKQTLQEIEIICVNDGSSDGSLAILEKYQQKDARIRIISQKNGGLSAARDTGLEKVSSPYVMFCDPDDTYDLRMCEKMVKAIDDSDADLAICGINMVYEAHEEMRESDENYYMLRFDGKKLINDRIVLETNGSACNKIYRMSIIKEYDISFPKGLNSEDHCFYCEYMSVSRTIYFLNQRLYNYVRREQSIMSDNFDGEKLSTDDIRIAEKIFHFYRKTGFLRRHKNLFWTQWVGGFWASYRYSGKKYHEEVLQLGKDFIEKYYEKYKPQDYRVQRAVEEVANYSAFYRFRQCMRNSLKRWYARINFAYRQQSFINAHLEEIYDRYKYTYDCLDTLLKEE